MSVVSSLLYAQTLFVCYFYSLGIWTQHQLHVKGILLNLMFLSSTQLQKALTAQRLFIYQALVLPPAETTFSDLNLKCETLEIVVIDV